MNFFGFLLCGLWFWCVFIVVVVLVNDEDDDVE